MRQITGMLLFAAGLLLSRPVIADSTVETVLHQWRTRLTANSRSEIHAVGRISTYDSVLQTETRRRFEVWSSGSNRFRLDMAPAELAAAVSAKRAPEGRPFAIVTPDRSSRWSLTGASFQSREAPVGQVPEARLVDLDSSWPILFLPREALRFPPHIQVLRDCSRLPEEPNERRSLHRDGWRVSLGSLQGQQGNQHLIFEPQSEEVRPICARIELLLDHADDSLKAFRALDSAGSSETVVVIEQLDDSLPDVDPYSEPALSRWPPTCNIRPVTSFGRDIPPPPPVAIGP